MLIRLIGTVAVVTPDGPVEITAPKLAGVLAALASRPGVAVSQHELIDRVWGSNPPDSVFNVVYSYIARLRTLLKPLPQVRIDRASGSSYTLSLPDDRVDVHLVHHLVAEATDIADAGDPAGALERLRRASTLAHAPALIGVPGPWAKSFRDGFHRERLSLLTERFRLELELGNHSTIVEELSTVVDSEPAAEPLVAHLMLAYYRCGRPADALNSFELTRRWLRDELGASPSQRLTSLHRQILNHDPALDGVKPQTGADRITPAQLPADATVFTGRRAELDDLSRLARSQDYTGLATVVGVGGVGKTALAVHWGHDNRDRFPGGQLYVNLRGFDNGEPITPVEALDRMLTALGHDGSAVPSNLDAAAEMFRSATSDSGTLVVLDNAHGVAQVRPLLPGSGCFTIITSRNRLTGLSVRDGAHPIRLATLSEDQSAALLRRLLNRARDEEIHRLARLCGNLPLALRIAAARIVDDPDGGVSGYCDQLQRDRLSSLVVEDDPESAIVNNLDLSLRGLDAQARDLFCRIGSLPGDDVAAELVRQVSPLSDTDTDRALARLSSGHLVEQPQRSRYRMHDLVRLYAGKRAHTELSAAERTELIDVFIDWHHDRAYQPVEDEEANIFAAAEALAGRPRLWRLILPLRNTINEGRSLERVQRVVEAGLQSSRTAGDDLGVFRMTNLLSSIANREGDLDGAIRLGETAARLADSLGHREQTIASGNLGVFHRAAGNLRGAADRVAKAVDLALRNDNLVSPRVFVTTLVESFTALGDPVTAREHLTRIETRLHGQMTDVDQVRFRIHTSTILIAEGRFWEAMTMVEEALELARGQADGYLTAQCLGELGEVFYRFGWAESAQTVLLTELTSSQGRDRTAVESQILCDHAAILVDLGEYHRAAGLVEAALRSKLPPTIAMNADITLATARNGLGDPAAALRAARRAVDNFAAMPWPARHEEALWALADAHARLGNVEAARECLATADAISSPANNGRRHRMRPAPTGESRLGASKA